jgi:hypothetical protein
VTAHDHRVRLRRTATAVAAACSLTVVGAILLGGSSGNAAPLAAGTGRSTDAQTTDAQTTDARTTDARATDVAAPNADDPRLAGRFQFTIGPDRWFAVLDPADDSHDGVTPPDGRFVWAQGSTTQAGLGDAGIDWSFPIVGSVGPVSPVNDPGSCLTQGAKWGQYGFEMADCDASANQRFQWTANGTALRSVGTGAYVGTDSSGYDDILHPTTVSGTPAVIDNSLLSLVPPKGEAAPVRITTPTEGETVTTRRPVFSGTGDPGASIEIIGPMGTIASTTVDGFSWSVASDVDLPDGTYTITVTQRTADGRVTTVTR